MNNPEFKEGDHVTFNAYGERIAACVRQVMPNRLHLDGSPDERTFYRLGAAENEHRSLVTVCTGMSIEESAHFVAPNLEE